MGNNNFTNIKNTAEPDLTTFGKQVVREAQITLNAVQIGIIQSFDPSEQSATIRLVFKQVLSISPDGTRTLREHPLILKCPVMTLFGGESFINLPIASGDYCIVLFNDREMDNWFVNGGVQVPSSGRVHDLSDAIAIVGIRSLQNSITDFLANGIRLQFSENSRIDITTDAINSIAALFTHTGSMIITQDLEVGGNFTVIGEVFGDGGVLNINDTIQQAAGKSIHAGNGANGTFNIVTVVDGIVISGT